MVRKVVAKVAKQPVDLNQISTVVHHGCMGLPQELVDYIMDMIQNDLLALKACSLACKSMFVSTRHLVHQTLWLTPLNNERVPARGGRFCYLGWNRREDELRFLSYVGEHGLLQYARQVQIRMPSTFTPDTLLPHFHHFQSLDRVHTLTIERYDPILWVNHYSTCFVHFYPTLTSLTLTRPLRHYRLLLRFVAQFPNLENLCLEWVTVEKRRRPRVVIPARIDQSPPLRGHLRLAGVPTRAPWVLDFTHELPYVVNFRSVQLVGFFAAHAQYVLNACAHTLEDLSIMPFDTGARCPLSPSPAMARCLTNFPPTGHHELENLKFTQNTVLRRFILRMSFRQVSTFALEMLPRVISTITSPAFCEFVLELTRVPSPSYWETSIYWGHWERIDRFLENQFSERGDFRLVIRTGELGYQETSFQARAKETFSLLASRGCIFFEISTLVDIC